MVRIKHRYLLLNVLYPAFRASKTSSTVPAHLNFHGPVPQHVTPQIFLSHLRSHITNLFGDHGLGLSLSSLKLVYFSHATSHAILRVPRAHFRLAWAALTHMNGLPGEWRSSPAIDCVIQVVRVSGTIRKAEEELVRRSRREVVRAKLAAEGKQSDLLDRLTAGPHSAPVKTRNDPVAEEMDVEDPDDPDDPEDEESEGE